MRKSYILQYAGDGARRIESDGSFGPLQDDPDRQYYILRGGNPVGD